MNFPEESAHLADQGLVPSQIEDLAYAKRRTLMDAGFNNGEIDTYFGQPPVDPKPADTHLAEHYKPFADWTKNLGGWASLSSRLSALPPDWFQGSLESVGKAVTYVNEGISAAIEHHPILKPIFATDQVIGSYLRGAMAGTLGPVTPEEMVEKMAKDRVRGEVPPGMTALDLVLQQPGGAAWAAAAKTMADFVSPINAIMARGPAVAGRLGTGLTDAATALTHAEEGPRSVVGKKLQTIQQTTGITPTEVVRSTETNVAITQDILSSNKPMPEAFQARVSLPRMTSEERATLVHDQGTGEPGLTREVLEEGDQPRTKFVVRDSNGDPQGFLELDPSGEFGITVVIEEGAPPSVLQRLIHEATMEGMDTEDLAHQLYTPEGARLAETLARRDQIRQEIQKNPDLTDRSILSNERGSIFGVNAADVTAQKVKLKQDLEDLTDAVKSAADPAARAAALAAKNQFAKVNAEDIILSKINVGEHDPVAPITFQRLYTAAVDDLNPIREAVKHAEEMMGKTIPPAENPYILYRLTRGTFGKADQMLENNTYDFNTYKNNGPGLRKIFEPIQDDLNGFRAYAAAKRSLEKTGQGLETGFDQTAAAEVVRLGTAKYEPIFRGAVEYMNRVTAGLRDVGIIDTATYTKMLEMNKDYAPFFRMQEEGGSGGPGTAGRGMNVRNPLRKMTGSEADIVDPIESYIKNTYLYIQLIEQNAAGKAFVQMAHDTGIPEAFVLRVPDKIKPITLTEPEIAKLFTEFMTTVKKESVTRSNTISSTSTSTGGTAGPTSSKALALIRDRVKEALTARGFHAGESEQMIARVEEGAKASPSTGGTNTTTTIEKVMKEIHKTEYVPEMNIRLPNDVATVFRTMKSPLAKNELAVFENGKRVVYETDPDIAAAFKLLDSESANMLVKLLAYPARALRAGAILAPEFIMRNPVRDQWDAFIQSKYVPGYDAVRGFISIIKKDEMYQNWLKGGGANSALVSMDRAYLQESIFKLNQETGLASRAWNVAKSPIEFLRISSELAENATRLGIFKRGVGEGSLTKAEIQAGAITSREGTLDFARMGAKTRAMNMITAFFNVGVQGPDRLIRAFNENPVATTIKLTASVTLPSLLLAWATKDDPRVKDLPDWQKNLFWIIPTEDHIFRIPKPPSLGVVFGSIPERIMLSFLDSHPDAMQSVGDALIAAFSPNLTITASAPIIEQFANRSLFTGSPLVSPEQEKLLPEYQYNEYTTETAKTVGALIGAFPGMKEQSLKEGFTGGVARALTTPALIENYLRDWTGGLGMHVLKLLDLGLRTAGVVPDPVLPAATLSDIPVVKAFVVRYPSASSQSIQDFYTMYYERKKVNDSILNAEKQGNLAEVDKLLEFDPQAMLLASDLRETITEHNQAIHLIYRNPDFTPEEKRQLIDELYYAMIELAGYGKELLRKP